MPSTSDSVPLRSEQDVVSARQTVRRLAQELKFSLVEQTKMVTAASELARNTVIHGRGGEMRWEIVQQGMQNGLRLVFSDSGPGIPDLDLALRDGWSSGNGMGLGLSGARRLVNDFEIDTTPGQGTRISIVRWR